MKRVKSSRGNFKHARYARWRHGYGRSFSSRWAGASRFKNYEWKWWNYQQRRKDQIYGYNVRKFLEATHNYPDRWFSNNELVYRHPMVDRQLLGSQVVGPAVRTLLQRLNLTTRLPSDYVGTSSLARPSYGGDLQAANYYWQLYPTGYKNYPHSNTSFDHPSVPSERQQFEEANRRANDWSRKELFEIGYKLFRGRIPGNLGDQRFIGEIRQPKTIKFKWYDFIGKGRVPRWTEPDWTQPRQADAPIYNNRPCFHYVQTPYGTKKVPCSQKEIQAMGRRTSRQYFRPISYKRSSYRHVESNRGFRQPYWHTKYRRYAYRR